MPILISQMTENDVGRVKEIEIECGLSPWSIENYLTEIKNPNSYCAIARENTDIDGFIVAGQNSQEQIAEIYNIGVLSTKRGIGIGSMLILELINKCRARNIITVSLEVRESNTAAINFYLSKSFVSNGRRPRFYSNPVEDALLMKIKLNND